MQRPRAASAVSRAVALFDPTDEEEALLARASGGGSAVGRAASPDAHVAVVQSFADLPEGTWSRMPALKWVVTLTAGAEHVPFGRLPEGARVVSTHGPNATAIAEHALALLLAAAKGIARDASRLAQGEFDQARLSKRIAGARIVVVGAGALGGEVLRLARAMGMRTACVRASGRPHPHADEPFAAADLVTALRGADFAVLCVPLTRATRGMMAAHELAALADDAVLVNVARGKLVDRDALARHLDAHPAFTYATDVWWRYPSEKDEETWDEPLAARANVLGTPHAAALVPEWRVEMVAAAARAVEALLEGRPLPETARVEDPADYDRIRSTG